MTLQSEADLSANCPECGSFRVAPLMGVCFNPATLNCVPSWRHICLDCDCEGPVTLSLEESRREWRDYMTIARRIRRIAEDTDKGFREWKSRDND